MTTIATSTVERWANTLEKLAGEIPDIERSLDGHNRAVEALCTEVRAFSAGVRFWLEANTVPPVKRPKRAKRGGKKRRK